MKNYQYRIFYEDGNFCTVLASSRLEAFVKGTIKAMKSGDNHNIEEIEDEDGNRFTVVLKFR